MGGLVNSSTVKGDLWMIEAGGSLSCYPLATTAQGPGPRVGHSSLLVGNAFIVYGGDTKIEEDDVLDETLYLLNTCESATVATFLQGGMDRVSMLMLFSDSAMVRGFTCGGATRRTVWPYFEHSWIQDLHFWRSGRGHLHE